MYKGTTLILAVVLMMILLTLPVLSQTECENDPDDPCKDCACWGDCHLYECEEELPSEGDEELPSEGDEEGPSESDEEGPSESDEEGPSEIGMFILSGVVSHAATPIRIFEHPNGLDCYFVGNGEVHYGLLIPHVVELIAKYSVDSPPVTLYDGMNTAMLEPMLITYLPGEEKIEVDTYYSGGRAYIFTIDEHNQVSYEDW